MWRFAFKWNANSHLQIYGHDFQAVKGGKGILGWDQVSAPSGWVQVSCSWVRDWGRGRLTDGLVQRCRCCTCLHVEKRIRHLNQSCWFTGASMFHHLQPHAVGSDRKKWYHGYKRRKKGSWSEDCLGFSLDTECWALCQRRGSDEGILLHAERIQLRWFGHLTRMLSGCLYVRCFRHVLLRGGPGADTGHTAEIVSLGWHNNISVSHKNRWSRLAWRGGGLASLLRLLSPWLGLRWAAENANCTDHFTQIGDTPKKVSHINNIFMVDTWNDLITVKMLMIILPQCRNILHIWEEMAPKTETQINQCFIWQKTQRNTKRTERNGCNTKGKKSMHFSSLYKPAIWDL